MKLVLFGGGSGVSSLSLPVSGMVQVYITASVCYSSHINIGQLFLCYPNLSDCKPVMGVESPQLKAGSCFQIPYPLWLSHSKLCL